MEPQIASPFGQNQQRQRQKCTPEDLKQIDVNEGRLDLAVYHLAYGTKKLKDCTFRRMERRQKRKNIEKNKKIRVMTPEEIMEKAKKTEWLQQVKQMIEELPADSKNLPTRSFVKRRNQKKKSYRKKLRQPKISQFSQKIRPHLLFQGSNVPILGIPNMKNMPPHFKSGMAGMPMPPPMLGMPSIPPHQMLGMPNIPPHQMPGMPNIPPHQMPGMPNIPPNLIYQGIPGNFPSFHQPGIPLYFSTMPQLSCPPNMLRKDPLTGLPNVGEKDPLIKSSSTPPQNSQNSSMETE